MKNFIAIVLVLHVSLLLLGNTSKAFTLDYSDENENSLDNDHVDLMGEDYADRTMGDESLLLAFTPEKRKSKTYKYRTSCVPRGGNCDHRPKHCCNSSSCRCNLWGVNCKCQRMGFFQKWGK